jgi:hypothetical protein
MKNVNANNNGTPAAEFFVFSMANMNPNAPPRKTIKAIPGDIARAIPEETPTQAPNTVGTIDNANSQ